MRKFLPTIILLSSFICIAVVSSPKRKVLKGVWIIDTVLVDGDTLFFSDNWKCTARFYKKNMNVKEEDKTEAYERYQTSCIKSTISSFSQARLTINKRNYDQTTVTPCWDHIKHPEVTKGEYRIKNDTLILIDSKMDLQYNGKLNMLEYKNSKFDYEITYKKTD